MLSSTTIITTLGSAYSGIGAIMVVGIGGVMIGTIALMGLGFGLNALSKWIMDGSRRVGGFYAGRLPYKGYKRFHTQKWNMEHMP